MNAFAKLSACAGKWRGTNRLYDPHTNQPLETESTAIVTPVLREKFVRLDYTWSYKDEPHEGSFLIGYDPQAGTFSTHWIDSWHMDNQVMSCHGTAENDGNINVLGSYAAPPGQDWGWLIIIKSNGETQLGINMFNITPDGQELPATEARYSRVQST
jgi:hypothetical protein